MPKVKKQFDFSKCKQRYIALKILYFGWNYDGLASQLDNENTVEYHLFQALTKTCLVESRDTCKYNRCGRTDKGVSSYGQVVNLTIRSNQIDEKLPQNIGLFTPECYTGPQENLGKQIEELNYVSMLNGVLPEDIKVIAWAPTTEQFSSRFSCKGRSYSYIFPMGNLCIPSMQQALLYLIGTHDFRNFCSFDLKNGVTNHVRTIISAEIKPITSSFGDQYSFYRFVIVGQGFLYHQIRCIMTILFLVGTGKESPDVVKDLLDIEKCPAQPHYNRASPLPLCLFDCKYNPEDLPLGWIYDLSALQNLLKRLKRLWLQYKTKCLTIEQVLLDLESPEHLNYQKNCESDAGKSRLNSSDWKDFGLVCDNMGDAKYIPLMERPRDEPLECKIEVLKKKRSKNTEH